MIVTESSPKIFSLGASIFSTSTGTLFVHVTTTYSCSRMVETASEEPYVSKSPRRSGVTFLIKALIGAESDMLDRIVSAVWAVG